MGSFRNDDENDGLGLMGGLRRLALADLTPPRTPQIQFPESASNLKQRMAIAYALGRAGMMPVSPAAATGGSGQESARPSADQEAVNAGMSRLHQAGVLDSLDHAKQRDVENALRSGASVEDVGGKQLADAEADKNRVPVQKDATAENVRQVMLSATARRNWAWNKIADDEALATLAKRGGQNYAALDDAGRETVRTTYAALDDVAKQKLRQDGMEQWAKLPSAEKRNVVASLMGSDYGNVASMLGPQAAAHLIPGRSDMSEMWDQTTADDIGDKTPIFGGIAAAARRAGDIYGTRGMFTRLANGEPALAPGGLERAQRIANGTATAEDFVIAASDALRNDKETQGQHWATQAATVTANSLPFMAEFILGGMGLFNNVTKVAGRTEAVGEALEAATKQAVNRMAAQSALGATGTALKSAAGTFARASVAGVERAATVGGGRVAAELADRRMGDWTAAGPGGLEHEGGDANVFNDLASAYANEFGNQATEFMGAAFGLAKPAAAKLVPGFMQGLAEATVRKVGANRAGRAVMGFMSAGAAEARKRGIQDIFSEIGEEELNQALNYTLQKTLGLDMKTDSPLIPADQLGPMALSFAASIPAMQAVGGAQRKAAYGNAKVRKQALDARLRLVQAGAEAMRDPAIQADADAMAQLQELGAEKARLTKFSERYQGMASDNQRAEWKNRIDEIKAQAAIVALEARNRLNAPVLNDDGTINLKDRSVPVGGIPAVTSYENADQASSLGKAIDDSILAAKTPQAKHDVMISFFKESGLDQDQEFQTKNASLFMALEDAVKGDDNRTTDGLVRVIMARAADALPGFMSGRQGAVEAKRQEVKQSVVSIRKDVAESGFTMGELKAFARGIGIDTSGMAAKDVHKAIASASIDNAAVLKRWNSFKESSGSSGVAASSRPSVPSDSAVNPISRIEPAASSLEALDEERNDRVIEGVLDAPARNAIQETPPNEPQAARSAPEASVQPETPPAPVGGEAAAAPAAQEPAAELTAAPPSPAAQEREKMMQRRNGGDVAAANAGAKPARQEDVSRLADILSSKGLVHGSENLAGKLIEAMDSGTFGDVVHPMNPTMRKVFTEITGRPLPKTVSGTKAVFDGTPIPYNLDGVNTVQAPAAAAPKPLRSAPKRSLMNHPPPGGWTETDKVPRPAAQADSDVATPAAQSAPTVPATETTAPTPTADLDAELADLYQQLGKKLAQMSSGVDPEIAVIGTKIAYIHVKKGVRKFAQFASAVKQALPGEWDKVKAFLHGFWTLNRKHADFAGAKSEIESLTDDQADSILDAIDAVPMAVAKPQQPVYNKDKEQGNEPDRQTRVGQPQDLGGQGVGQRGIDRDGNQSRGGGSGGQVLAGAPAQDVEAPANATAWASPSGSSVAAGGGGSAQPATVGTRPSGRVAGGRQGLADDGTGGRRRADGLQQPVESDGTGRSGSTVELKRETQPGRKPVRSNYFISNPEEISGAGSPRQRFEKNRRAIETYQALTDSGKTPTKEDLDALAAFTGWGSFGQELFQGTFTSRYLVRPEWVEADGWLRSHLGEEAWRDAQESIINAHYTDPPTVQAMWGMVERMGFRGGIVLEPAAGIGNFLGLMPRKLEKASQLTAIEMEQTSGGMVGMLYPNANVRIQPYQKSETPDGFYDLVIGNWPFANVAQKSDKRYGHLAPMLHDYFFLKAVDQVRPGGVVIGITSTGTMDKAGTSVRLELAKKSDLVAAFRLPAGAFERYAGTKVVTDIIVLRKREELNPTASSEAWVSTSEVKTPSGNPVRINSYYAENPKNILGTLDWGHGTTTGRPGMVVNRPDNYRELLDALPGRVKKNVFGEKKGANVTYISNAIGERNKSITIKDDELYVVSGDHMAKLGEVYPKLFKFKDVKKAEALKQQVRDVVALRQAIGSTLDADRSGSEDADSLRAAAFSQYKAFTAKYGPLHNSKAEYILDKVGDPFRPMILATERNVGTTDNPKWEPAAIYKRAVVRAEKKIDRPSISDAYILHRNKSIDFDAKAIAELAHTTEEEVIKELASKGAIFQTPSRNWEPREVYLNGNVRKRLREALAAQDAGMDMTRNIEVLKSVVPRNVPHYEIEAPMGANWIDIDSYSEFIAGLLNTTMSEVKVSENPRGWDVRIDDNVLRRAESYEQWGTSRAQADKIAEAAMNSSTIVIKDRDKDGEHVNEEESKKAMQKVAAMRDAFAQWVWKDPERRIRLENQYNELRNNAALAQYDGSHMTFDGMAMMRGESEFSLRKHQVNAIYRGVVLGRSLNAHEVGTGKTYTIAGICIESRRFGIARKPVVFAHNANSAQVYEALMEMYPAAKVLYVDNLKPDTKKETIERIRTEEWDAVVVPHSLLPNFQLKPETLTMLSAEEIAELEAAAMDAAGRDDADLSVSDMDNPDAMKKVRSPTAKALVKERQRIKDRIAAAQKAVSADAVFFEDLGVDMLVVDEAHEFKKQSIATAMRVKGLNASASNKGGEMAILADYVKKTRNGKGVHLFTGTPITNTITELYNMMRLTMDDIMRSTGVRKWDNWFKSYASTVDDQELNAADQWESVERLAAFINVPELRREVGQVMDIVFADDMPEFKPRQTKSGKVMGDNSLTPEETDELANGITETGDVQGRPYKRVVTDVAKMTMEQSKIFNILKKRISTFNEATRKDRKAMMMEGSKNVPIQVENAAANASLDARLFENTDAADEENSKVNRCVRNVMRHYEEHPKSTQMIFMQRGFSDTGTVTKKVGYDADGNAITEKSKVNRFNVASDIIRKLVDRGIPRNRIAIIDGSVAKEKRKEIADAMQRGEIRVAIGLTGTMGTGVNAQTWMRAIHHLDAPWMPGDLEQRNGRGHRQGNRWNTMIEYRYVTAGIDGRRWQVLIIKDQFIKSFLRNKLDKRVIEGDATSLQDKEDVGDLQATFSSAAGDPRIMLREVLKKKVDRLRNKESQHYNAIEESKRTAENLVQKEIPRLEKANSQYAELSKLYQESRKNRTDFEITLGKTVYTKRDEADAALLAAVKTGRSGDIIGQYRGVVVRVGWLNGLYLGTKSEAEVATAHHVSTLSIDATLRNLPDKIKQNETLIREKRVSAASLEEGKARPFGMAEDLKNKVEMLAQVEADLMQFPTPPPAWLVDGAPVGMKVKVDGVDHTVVGHRWADDGWYVMVSKNDGTGTAVSYETVKDENGFPIYKHQDFVPPEDHEGNETSATRESTNGAEPAPREGHLSRGESAPTELGFRVDVNLPSVLDEVERELAKYGEDEHGYITHPDLPALEAELESANSRGGKRGEAAAARVQEKIDALYAREDTLKAELTLMKRASYDATMRGEHVPYRMTPDGKGGFYSPSAGGGIRPPAQILEALRAALPAADIQADPDGRMAAVTLPGGRQFNLEIADNIDITDRAAFEAEHGRTPRPGEKAAAVWFGREDLLQLAGYATDTEIAHDAFHVAESLADLEPAERRALAMKFGTGPRAAGVRANAYAEFVRQRSPAATALERAFAKVRDFFRRIAEALGYTSENTVFSRVHSGEAFSASREERERPDNPGAADTAYQAVGDRFKNAVMPTDNEMPSLLDASGSNERIIMTAAQVVKGWPKTVIAADGSSITLSNPEGGSMARRVQHLIWDNDANRLHVEKAKWLPMVPRTLEMAAKRIVDPDSDNHIYVRKYGNGVNHMVVVRPDGTVESQKAFTGKLITQFPYSEHGRQDGFVIDWERGGKGEGRLPGDPNPTPAGSANPDSRQREFHQYNSRNREDRQGPQYSPSAARPGVEFTAKQLTTAVQFRATAENYLPLERRRKFDNAVVSEFGEAARPYLARLWQFAVAHGAGAVTPAQAHRFNQAMAEAGKQSQSAKVEGFERGKMAGMMRGRQTGMREGKAAGAKEEKAKGRILGTQYGVDKAMDAIARSKGADELDWWLHAGRTIRDSLPAVSSAANPAARRLVMETVLRGILGEHYEPVARQARHAIDDAWNYVLQETHRRTRAATEKRIGAAVAKYSRTGLAENQFVAKMTDGPRQRMLEWLNAVPVSGGKFSPQALNPDQLVKLYDDLMEILAEDRLNKWAIINNRSVDAVNAAHNLADESIAANKALDSGLAAMRAEARETRGVVKDMLVDGLAGQNEMAMIGFGKTGDGYDVTYEQLRRGDTAAKAMTSAARKELDDALASLRVGEMSRLAWQSAKRITVDGREQVWTPAEMMTLYALWQRPEARLKIMRNGFIREALSGTQAVVSGRDEEETAALVEEITGNLTDEQRAVATKMVDILTGMSGEANKVSKALYGISRFHESRYFPMRVEGLPQQISDDPLAGPNAFTKSLEGVGFAKVTQDHRHPLKIGNAFETFEDHIEMMGKYAHLTLPIRNVVNILNADGQVLAKALNEALGKKYVRRLKDTMLELSGLGERRPVGGVSRVLNAVTGNVAKSILAWNPASYINNRHGGAMMYTSELWHEDRALAAKFAALAAQPVNLGNWFGGEKNKEDLAFLMENGYLAERWNYDVTQVYIPVRSDRTDEGIGYLHKVRVLMRWVQQKSLQPMKHAEQRNAVLLYQTLVGSGQYTTEQARNKVELLTRSTQNSSSALEDSAFIRSLRRSGFGGIFPFMTQAVVARNLVVRDFLAMTRDGKVTRRGVENLAVSTAALVVSGIALQMFLNAMRGAITGTGGGGDDPEKESRQLGLEATGQIVENVFLPVRPIVEIVTSSAEGMRSTGGMLLFDRPVTNLFSAAGKFIGDVAETGSRAPNERDMFNASLAMLQMFGLPTGGPGLAARASGLGRSAKKKEKGGDNKNPFLA